MVYSCCQSKIFIQLFLFRVISAAVFAFRTFSTLLSFAKICVYCPNCGFSQRQSILSRSAPCLQPQIYFMSRLKPPRMLWMIYQLNCWLSPRRIAVSILSLQAQIFLSSVARLTCTIRQSWIASPSGKEISLPFRPQCLDKSSSMTIERIGRSERGEIMASMWSRLLLGGSLARYGSQQQDGMQRYFCI